MLKAEIDREKGSVLAVGNLRQIVADAGSVLQKIFTLLEPPFDKEFKKALSLS